MGNMLFCADVCRACLNVFLNDGIFKKDSKYEGICIADIVTQQNKLILFRPHGGGTVWESMNKVTAVDSLADLKEKLLNHYGYMREYLNDAEIKTKHYCYDDRINWETWIVLADGAVIGYTNEELK